MEKSNLLAIIASVVITTLLVTFGYSIVTRNEVLYFVCQMIIYIAIIVVMCIIFKINKKL